MSVTLLQGDCLELMKTIPDGSVDAVVTDPPAGIGFMGKKWDTPGSLVERQPDRSVAWDRVGGNHNPKDGIDLGRTNRVQGARFREWLTPRMAEALRIAKPGSYALVWALPRTSHWTATAIEDAGWTIRDRVSHLFGQGFPKAKSCLKPACEDWWLAWKPAARVTPLQIDACRIETETRRLLDATANVISGDGRFGNMGGSRAAGTTNLGRWPANVVLDEEAAAILDRQSGTLISGKVAPHHMRNATAQKNGGGYGGNFRDVPLTGHGDSGGASRFFYTAKASRSDRGEGNTHPTVKSTALMRWLCRLITPPGGTVADPFAGSGTTGVAAVLEGFGFLGFESDPDYFAIAERRIAAAATPLFAEAQ